MLGRCGTLLPIQSNQSSCNVHYPYPVRFPTHNTLQEPLQDTEKAHLSKANLMETSHQQRVHSKTTSHSNANQERPYNPTVNKIGISISDPRHSSIVRVVVQLLIIDIIITCGVGSTLSITRHIHNRTTKLRIQPSIHKRRLPAIDILHISIDTSNRNSRSPELDPLGSCVLYITSHVFLSVGSWPTWETHPTPSIGH
ncbi:hypothetical protein EDD22DRAFT_622077 [Suillus occidentalis]|nr:hypothetical protein EDD22DRAFT_622077 [Suillus occidentalis]